MTEIASVIAAALSEDFESQKDALGERTGRADGALPALPAARPAAAV